MQCRSLKPQKLLERLKHVGVFTCLLVGCQVLLELDAQHLVFLAHLGQRVLQLDDLGAELLLQGQLVTLPETGIVSGRRDTGSHNNEA